MRAVTVVPHSAGSLNVEDLPEPTAGDGPVMLQMLAVGVCGTDRRILAGAHGEAPIGRHRLVLGHESVGRVVEAPSGSDLHPGDLVVPLVRRADPVPCPNCAADHPDMCRNGLYTEHGIKGADGFLRERIRTTPDRLVKVEEALGPSAVLVEPTSIAAKGWDGVRWAWDRTPAQPRSVLITGAGPVGTAGGTAGPPARTRAGPAPAGPHRRGEARPRPQPRRHLSPRTDRGPRPHPGRRPGVHRRRGGDCRRDHYRAAAAALARADQDWLGRLISRRVGLDDARSAFDVQPFDVKSAIVMEDHA